MNSRRILSRIKSNGWGMANHNKGKFQLTWWHLVVVASGIVALVVLARQAHALWIVVFDSAMPW